MTQALVTAAGGPLTPSVRVRALLLRDALSERGVELEPILLFDREQELRFRSTGAAARVGLALGARRRLIGALRASPAEVALVQRQADLFPTLRAERSAWSGRRLVLDVDDAVWLDSSSDAGGHRLAVFKRTATKLRTLAERADHVIAGNELLAEWLGRYARQVTVVPSLVDTAAYAVRRHEDAPDVVLGWIGSGSTASHLAARLPALARAAAAAPGRRWRLEVLGAGATLEQPGLDIVARQWSEAAERDLLGRMDIGLMPLPDNPWTRGKCAYKALQYMAAGVPVVADEVGVSAQVIGHGVGGYVAADDADWVEGLVSLAGDAARRATLGAAGRQRVEDDFSVRRWASVVASTIRGSE